MLARSGQQRKEHGASYRRRAPRRAHDSLLAAVLRSAPDCVVVIDRRGALVELNRATERMFRCTREEMLGRELADIVVPPSLRRRHRQTVRRLVGGGGGGASSSARPIVDRCVELPGMRSDGSEFPLELTIAQVADEPALFAGFLRDATEQAKVTHVAHVLERSLLPDALPVIEGLQLASVYRPVGEENEAGGDFYDVFQTPTGCWLTVGDVCGKGSEAAAVTAIVRHSIRALGFQQSSPSTVLATVNQAMLSHELAGRFATVVLARIDLISAGARVLLASAGHPSPVLLEHAGGARCLPTEGTLLGVLSTPTLRDLEVQLGLGDTLVLYTDGLTDAGAPERSLTEEDLCAHLDGRATRPVKSLVAGLEDLALSRSDTELRDDVAILAARVGR
jgi:PAS domain S-box-containing protein